jgi:hypothetical protein
LHFSNVAGEEHCSVIFASSQVAGAPPPSLPSPEHGSPPTEREALEREKMLTAQYPLFDKASGRSSIVQSDLNGYNEFYFFLENEEYRPFDGCEIEILDKFTKYIF